MDSGISCDFVRTFSECESAAQELGLTDVTVEDDGQYRNPYDPPFCYFEAETLKFNKWGTNTGPCTNTDVCVCRQNDACAMIPCEEGQGDCDNDAECEGSLVCGQMNCLNSTISDCCTQPCNMDSDCKSGECIAGNKQCRLTFDTIPISRTTSSNIATGTTSSTTTEHHSSLLDLTASSTTFTYGKHYVSWQAM